MTQAQEGTSPGTSPNQKTLCLEYQETATKTKDLLFDNLQFLYDEKHRMDTSHPIETKSESHPSNYSNSATSVQLETMYPTPIGQEWTCSLVNGRHTGKINMRLWSAKIPGPCATQEENVEIDVSSLEFPHGRLLVSYSSGNDNKSMAISNISYTSKKKGPTPKEKEIEYLRRRMAEAANRPKPQRAAWKNRIAQQSS